MQRNKKMIALPPLEYHFFKFNWSLKSERKIKTRKIKNAKFWPKTAVCDGLFN